MRGTSVLAAAAILAVCASPARAQDPHAGHTPPPAQPDAAPDAAQDVAPGWRFMQDGVIFALFNRQGGPRGDTDAVLPTWWMGMATRQAGRHQLGLTAMLSLDAATVGKSGYGEIFQVGETLDGRPLIDRQHPHDLFMQLSGSWQVRSAGGTSVTIAGAPVGEPTLGPAAFMHRPSAAGLVLAPLGHHTFDATHISFGVVTAAVERGRWTIEGSAFNGREPDEDRWDFDLDALDSYAARVWFAPAPAWVIQVSSGRLREPEALVAGDLTRTTTSVSWFEEQPDGLRAVTAGYGVNAAHGERRHGAFGELTVERGANSISGRLDVQQVETHVLLTGDVPDESHAGETPATVTALTVGGARRVATWRGFEGAAGAHVTFYGVPQILEPTHGERPVSFQVFLRQRLPTLGGGRMWNMRMSRPHLMPTDSAHAGHVMP